MIELADLLAAGGELAGSPIATTFTDWCYDSRIAQAGQCFVALRTERRDGHDFIADAIRRGCTGVVCTQPPVDVAATVVVVPDVRLLLQVWASTRVRDYGPHVIAVTGSVGKTSTKRTISTMLAGIGPVFRSRRSFNSLLGLPISISHLTAEARFAVLEMGVDRFGEMRRLAELFPPRIAVVTNVAPAHLNYLRDEAHIAAEKSDLVAALPEKGWAVLNFDDPRVVAMAQRTNARLVWYGLSDEPDTNWQELSLRSPIPPVLGRNITVGLDGTHFDVHCAGMTHAAYIPLIGQHHVYTALAATAVGLIYGLSLADAVARLALVKRQAGRLNPLPGIRGSAILDDTYNASPASVQAALQALAAIPARRRIAVLGPMLELGKETQRWHHLIGAQAARVCDLVVTVGETAALMIRTAEGESHLGDPSLFSLQATNPDAIDVVRPQLGTGDVVLIKGSSAARLEEVVAGLLVPDAVPAEMLVRQEAAWDNVRVSASDRPTWLEIDLRAIANNVGHIRRLIGPHVKMMAVLKADAYGHGAVHTARTVLQHGATHLAVATVGEAIALRNANITAPVVILGYVPPWQVRDALRYDVQMAVFDPEVACEVSLAAEELRRTAQVHVKIDTGMTRLGLAPENALPLMYLLHELTGIEVVGLFTHLATADSGNPAFAQVQLERFENVLREIEAAGLRPPLVHAANSATLLRYPRAHYDLVRPGILLYGLDPSHETPAPAEFQPALQFKTEIAQVKTVAVGTSVSYGATWTAQRPSAIATIPVGYADGFRRAPAWQAVLVRGQRVPVVGRVCMDYTMLDVTDVPGVRVGDEVVLLGQQGTATITAEQVGDWLGTINYEVISAILPRVPRVV